MTNIGPFRDEKHKQEYLAFVKDEIKEIYQKKIATALVGSATAAYAGYEVSQAFGQTVGLITGSVIGMVSGISALFLEGDMLSGWKDELKKYEKPAQTQSEIKPLEVRLETKPHGI